MKKIYSILEQLFDYLVITLILLISLGLVLPFTTVFGVVIAYFATPSDSRTLKGMWRIFKANYKNYLLYGLFTTLMMGMPILSIRVFTIPTTLYTQVFIFLSWTLLFLGLLFLLFAPIVIIRMQVSFRQLVINSIAVIVRGHITSLILVVVAGGVLVLGLYYPLALVPSLYFVAFIDTMITEAIINKLKKESYYESKDLRSL